MRKSRGTGRTTIVEVARHAGVGAITVSRFLRQPDKVSRTLGHKIQVAIDALDYVPDLNARALASHHTNAVAVFVPSLSQNIFSDVLRGIYDGIGDSDLRVEIANTRYDADIEERQVAAALKNRPAAVIVSGVEQNARTQRMLREANCPVIQIMDLTDDPIQKVIGFSHEKAGWAMTRHLVEAGYRRIAFFSGWLSGRAAQRMHGYVRAMKQADLFDATLIRAAGDEAAWKEREGSSQRFSTAAMGRTMMLEALCERPDIDAVFCNTDVLSLGTLSACQERGIDVPDQIGLAGFNDFEYMEATWPPMSSVRIPRYECGYEAMMCVRHRLNGGEMGDPIVDLGFSLMQRASTSGASRRP